MNSRFRFPLLNLLLLILVATLLPAQTRPEEGDLTVHEWGTFTAVAGKDGRAVEWTPLSPALDIPGFVEHLNGANFKIGLRGTIRMETPVLYFYSPRKVKVSVHAALSKGLITEWYPHAAQVQPQGILRNANLDRLRSDGNITWTDVTVSPDLKSKFPRESQGNHYYTARETSATPLQVETSAGTQQEKFLFYRGVSAFPLPLAALQNSGGKLLVGKLWDDDIPSMIFFQRRGKQIGYSLAGPLTDEATLVNPPLTGSVDSLCRELESVLINEGLYVDEAQAMVETWRDSWFEEGSRLIYIVPRSFIDKVVPLTINPVPASLTRVFVGRLEIVTPDILQAVKAAVATNDTPTLEKYGRFVEPILHSDTVKPDRRP